MSQPYTGELRMFGGDFAPVGWMFCQGQTLAISEYDTLFNLLGTTYGGDGQQTFNLPDLRSRVPVHMGPSYTIGQSGGVETVTLTVSQIPAHSHAPQANSGTGTSTDPNNNFWAAQPALLQYSANGTANVDLPANTIANTGGSQPHDNMIPFLGLNFIICLFGTFPTQT